MPDSPLVQDLCDAVARFVSGQHGGHYRWILQSYNERQDMGEVVHPLGPGEPPIYGGPPTMALELSFQGVAVAAEPTSGTPDLDPGAEEEGPLQESREMLSLRNSLAGARAKAYESEEDLRKERNRRKTLERTLEECQDEEEQLIRRLTVKTQARFGVDHRAMFTKFLRWVLLHQGVDMVKTGVGRDQFIDGKFEGAMTEEMVQMAGEMVDEFMTSPEAPVGAILPPSEGGESDE